MTTPDSLLAPKAAPLPSARSQPFKRFMADGVHISGQQRQIQKLNLNLIFKGRKKNQIKNMNMMKEEDMEKHYVKTNWFS